MQDETQTHPCWLCPADLGTPGRGDIWQRVPWCPHPSPKRLSGGMKSSQCLCTGHILIIVLQLQPGPAFALGNATPEPRLCIKQLLQPFFLSIFPAPTQPAAPVLCPRSTAQHPTLSDKDWCKDKLFQTVPVPTLKGSAKKKNHFC